MPVPEDLPPRPSFSRGTCSCVQGAERGQRTGDGTQETGGRGPGGSQAHGGGPRPQTPDTYVTQPSNVGATWNSHRDFGDE